MTDRIEANNHSFILSKFHSSLQEWDATYRRTYPWRLTINPYHILIAELMLRRTQAKQVVRVYNNFIELYPDVYSLANASAEDISHILYPLGLSWRVSAFQAIARTLIEKYSGTVPAQYAELITLPGVGDYVASAVCCFAFDQKRCIIDTNTVRVAGRLFGIQTHAESRRRKPIQLLLHSLLNQKDPKSYNYALLDLAALICTPKNPQCTACPIQPYCVTGLERR